MKLFTVINASAEILGIVHMPHAYLSHTSSTNILVPECVINKTELTIAFGKRPAETYASLLDHSAILNKAPAEMWSVFWQHV